MLSSVQVMMVLFTSGHILKQSSVMMNKNVQLPNLVCLMFVESIPWVLSTTVCPILDCHMLQLILSVISEEAATVSLVMLSCCSILMLLIFVFLFFFACLLLHLFLLLSFCCNIILKDVRLWSKTKTLYRVLYMDVQIITKCLLKCVLCVFCCVVYLLTISKMFITMSQPEN